MKKELLLLIFLFLPGCKKDEKDNNSGTQLNYINSTVIYGITETDQNGNTWGHIDKNDWTILDSFGGSIPALFNFSDTVDYSMADTSTIKIYEYPNPTVNYFSLFIRSSNTTVLKYVIVDESNHIYFNGALNIITGNNSFMFDVYNSPLVKGQTYRMYYKLYKSDHKHFASGHGDIKIG